MAGGTPFPEKLYTVQALRGIAAWLVLLFHMAGVQKEQLASTRDAEISLLSGLWDYGFIGVDLFFVISGFIMVYVTRDTPQTFSAARHFLYQRASRIYPLWWVVACLMMLYFWMSYGQVAPPDRISGEEIFPYTVKSFFLIPQYHNPVLAIGWTLIHEMYFYVIFSGLILLSRRHLPVWLMLWAGVVLFANMLMPTPSRARDLISLMCSPLTLEFLAGAAIGLTLTRKMTTKWVLMVAAILALGLGGVGLVLMRGDVALPLVIQRVMWCTVPFALCVYLAVLAERRHARKPPQWLTILGDWSYSLYLTHMLVLLVLRRLFGAISPYLPAPLRYAAEGPLDNLLFCALALPAAMIVAGLSHHFVERPLLRASRRLYPATYS